MKVHVKNRQCFSIILVFMLSFSLIGVYAQTNQPEATVTITQPTLPTITFNDAPVNVRLSNTTGVGFLEMSSLIGSTVVTENLGSNMVEFQLDPNGPYAANNAVSGVFSNSPFTLQNFETANLTVQFNGTHFRINHSDNTFAGTTPGIAFQASIHSAAGVIPAINESLGTLTFGITVVPICEITAIPLDATFGTVNVDNTSSDIPIVVQNSGNIPIDVDIGGDYWCDATDNGCTGSNGVIFPNQTRYGTTLNQSYADKTAFDHFEYDSTGGVLTRGTTESPFLTPDLFTLVANGANTIYFQVQVDLIPAASMFAGAASQEITLESECS